MKASCLTLSNSVLPKYLRLMEVWTSQDLLCSCEVWCTRILEADYKVIEDQDLMANAFFFFSMLIFEDSACGLENFILQCDMTHYPAERTQCHQGPLSPHRCMLASVLCFRVASTWMSASILSQQNITMSIRLPGLSCFFSHHASCYYLSEVNNMNAPHFPQDAEDQSIFFHRSMVQLWHSHAHWRLWTEVS